MDNNQIMNAIDQAFDNATKPVQKTQPKPSTASFADPEEYRKSTGKRFRMTKNEKSEFGDTSEGRQRAFEARMQAGTLEM
jgi:hypothetical protein